MIQRLINGAWTLFVYACVATIVAQAILLGYMISAWKINQERWLRVLAAAQGIESTKGDELSAKAAEDKSSEQPSYEQILETRALKYRNLELREQELRNNLLQLQNQESKLADNKKRYQRLHNEFDTQLSSLSQGSVATGKEEVRRTLETIKPKQAKQLILGMLDNKEIGDVVTLLSPMPDAKRAKIIGEFKTPEEMEKISEVLRRIREGAPSAEVSDSTRKQLEQANNSPL